MRGCHTDNLASSGLCLEACLQLASTILGTQAGLDIVHDSCFSGEHACTAEWMGGLRRPHWWRHRLFVTANHEREHGFSRLTGRFVGSQYVGHPIAAQVTKRRRTVVSWPIKTFVSVRHRNDYFSDCVGIQDFLGVTHQKTRTAELELLFGAPNFGFHGKSEYRSIRTLHRYDIRKFKINSKDAGNVKT